ncbi:hypothetical protein Nepgr_024369 [Nepenthes gracilis]|uniref:Uncharacterized protein n=1 Tax=Nepenthes gracilis TaxID=150966 RepID=A0AAD3T4J6_NEPGR|nr:hypothetical protein Nepgr_024369 [Nepenthes gracilis]
MAATLFLLKPPIMPHKPPRPNSKLQPHSNSRESMTPNGKNKAQKNFIETTQLLKSTYVPLTAIALPLLNTKDALAIDGEFGLLEGRTLSLIHPVVMGSLFLYTLWAGFLGWQWRRVRTIQNEINELKKQVKPVAVTPDGNPASDAPPSPVETKIQQLTEDRKELLKGNFRDRHFNAGSILLGFGVFESIGGGVNTWFRTGKLFPGPHLFAGAAITVLWAQRQLLFLQCRRGAKQQETFT